MNHCGVGTRRPAPCSGCAPFRPFTAFSEYMLPEHISMTRFRISSGPYRALYLPDVKGPSGSVKIPFARFNTAAVSENCVTISWIFAISGDDAFSL